MPDHVRMMISIPLRYAISQVVGFIKGKRAIHIVRIYVSWKKNYVASIFCLKGYFVSAVDENDKMIREYIRHQKAADIRVGQLNLKWLSHPRGLMALLRLRQGCFEQLTI